VDEKTKADYFSITVENEKERRDLISNGQ